MTRLYGRSYGKNRVYDCVKDKPELKMTLISALSINGLVAPFEFEGYLNTHTFYYYLKDIFIPCFKPGQVLVMDNLSSHKSEIIQELLQENNIKVIYLPSYSPTLNPIEMCWSVIKSYLRKFMPRTKVNLQLSLSKAVSILENLNLSLFFRHCWNL